MNVPKFFNDQGGMKKVAEKLCPKCGIDSAIGSAAGVPLTKKFLDEMNKLWF